MKKRAWKTKIRKACKEAGTYKPFFDPVIDTLAEILEKRDEALEMYNEDEEEKIVVEITSRSGKTKVKNPLIAIWEDLNKIAISYWRELGLTPAGLKKINEESFAKTGKQSNTLIDLLNQKKETKEHE